MKNQQQQKETGSPYVQMQERRSIPLWKDNERHFMSWPINIDRKSFKKSPEERADMKLAKKWWKATLPANYKPELLIRA